MTLTGLLVVIGGIIIALVAMYFVNKKHPLIPEGYEDENGFHYGKKEETKKWKLKKVVQRKILKAKRLKK